MSTYQEFYRGVLVRSPGLLHKSVALTPSLGVTLYTDPQLQAKPVLELCKLRMGLDRSIMQSWDDDVKLAMWDPDARDEFFNQANHRGITKRFRHQRLEHKANVIAAINLLSGATLENLHNAVSGAIQPASKEMDADFAKEMVEMAYNDVFSTSSNLVDGIASGSLSPTILGYAIERVMHALDNTRAWDNPTELFQSILLSNKQLCEQLMESTADGHSYLRNVVDESSSWLAKERYFHTGLRDFDVLAVEPSADFLTRAVYGDINGQGKREPNDFSGDFPVLAQLWSLNKQPQSRMNAYVANHLYGFNIGPSNFRKYDLLRERIERGQPWLGGTRMIDSRVPDNLDGAASMLTATPPDLPVELAQRRLELLQAHPGAQSAVVELTEIVTADAEGRPVNPAKFRDASITQPPAHMLVDATTLDHLNELVEQALVVESGEQAVMNEPGHDNPWLLKLATAEVNELQFWREQHPDYQPASGEHQAPG